MVRENIEYCLFLSRHFSYISGLFQSVLLLWWMHIIWNTYRKVTILVKMRGQWSSYEPWFRRYEIWSFSASFSQNDKISHTCSSEGYTLYDIRIWKEGHITRMTVQLCSCNLVLMLLRILTFSAFFSQNGYFSHFCCLDGYILYQTPIEMWTFRLKWVVIQLHTSSGSRDIGIGYLWPFSAIFSHIESSAAIGNVYPIIFSYFRYLLSIYIW